MKILDRYILKNFIQNFFFGLFCFIIIFILIDLFENLDKFVDRQVPADIIINYYLNFVPEIIKLLIPVATLLASLFTISRFNTYSEFTAMQSGGMSLARYLTPIIGFGLILTIFSLYFNGWIVPESNKAKFALERTYLGKNQIKAQVQNLYLQDNFNRIITIGLYNEAENKTQNVSVQVFNADTLTNLKYRLDIYEMKWDSINTDWKGKNIIYREFINDSTVNLEEYKERNMSDFQQIGKINLTPGIITKNQLKPDELSISEYRQFIDNLKSSGLASERAEVDYYSKFSFPFASLITILFGASISVNRRRGGAALQFGISILVSFIYLGFVKISQVFGYNGEMSPVLTAWFANIIFLAIAVVNFLRMRI